MDSFAVAAEFKFAGAQDDSGLVEGYGSVFGVRDSRGDVVAPGAFAGTLASMRARGFNVPMYLNHGAAMGGDNLPAGVWDEIAEDDTGLRVKGRMLGLNTDTGRYRYELAKGGALRGLSIGFITRKADYGKSANQPRRTIKAVDLVEVSLVDDPANPAARVTSLKSARDMREIKTIREFEDFLRDEGGFSHAAARAIAASGFKAKATDPRDEDGADASNAALRRLLSTIRS
jgi:HK97 family phage prohead protease